MKMLLTLALSACLPIVAHSQSATDDIAKYREMLAEGNPADLWEMRGEELWKAKKGPKNASLENCDLGAGPGVVEGAYVKLPRYFADVKKVQDVEQRLITCMTTLQGLTEAEVTKQPFGAGASKRSDMEALVSYIAANSRGMKIAPGTAHPEEKRAFEIGQKIFFMQGGPYDFACATCHSSSDKRIRLQDLPNLTNKQEAQKTYAVWPAYRVSQGEVRTMQHRLADCFRQQRFPEPVYGSEALTALTMYLARQAEGGEFNAPGLKR